MEEQTLTGKLAQDENQDNLFSLHDIVQMVLTNWYWFLISMAICLGAAYYYIAKTPKIYVRTATILVKDTRKGGDIDVTAFSDLAGFQSRRSVDNEVYILQSRRLMTEVVRKLRLTTNYSVRDGLRRKDLYGQAPVDITFIDDSDNQRLSMQVVPRSDEKAALTGFRDGIVGDADANRTIEVQYGDTVSTPIGRLVVNKTYYMSPSYYGTNIAVMKSPLSATTSAYRGAVRCEVANKLASVVTISMSNTVPRRAEDVINTLISEYNEDAIDDKRRVSITTADFIKSRLEIIGRELGAVDENIENFKKNNRMYDLSSEAVRSISESSKYKTEGLSVENQINVAEFIRSYLLDAATAGELIPAMASVESPEIATQIAAYNEAVLRREKLRANSSESNPVIRELDNSLAALRRAIVSPLDSFVSTLESRRDALRKEEELANRRIATVPSQEKEILGITRQQKIKEELFLYLLNKQEENQLNFAVAESNARTIDQAYGSSQPVSPRKSFILLAALLAGLAIPFGLIYLLNMLDTSIRGRRDLEERLSAPFLGEIPKHGDKSSDLVIVRETGRDAVSEAFRILRSNVSFMNVTDRELKTILLTSSNPHAGKTFISLNLAATMAMAGKKVVLIDLDLRRHALSNQLGHRNSSTGITSYLAGKITDSQLLISPSGITPNLDVIYAGIQPPNPSEMLLSEKLDKLVARLRETYDYILLDSTPALSVADAVVTDRLCDLCIYIVREGVLDRRQLPDIERLYREK